MGRNLLRVPVHFVWATWDRLPLIGEAQERRLHRHISAICEECHCEVLTVGGMPDHVHVLIKTLPSTISLGDLMKRVKGGSSHFVSETLMPGEWFAWQGSYGALAVCQRDITKIIDYIGHQKQHHAEGTLWTAAEQVEEDDTT